MIHPQVDRRQTLCPMLMLMLLGCLSSQNPLRESTLREGTTQRESTVSESTVRVRAGREKAHPVRAHRENLRISMRIELDPTPNPKSTERGSAQR